MVGGIIGWLARIIMRSPEGTLLNIFVGIVGIVGSLLSGRLIPPLVGPARSTRTTSAWRGFWCRSWAP
jgi:uncharacterized membrane protein YeaQ/YmgE (transglycosylase-associated protein family)